MGDPRCNGYHQYEDPAHGRMCRAFLHGRAWAHAEGPVALFNHAASWLCRHRVLLPGANVLARQVSEVRTIVEKRLHAAVAKASLRADPALPGDLLATLNTPEGTLYSELERMRQPPTRSTGTAMKCTLQRVEGIAAFGLGRLKLWIRYRRTGSRCWPGTERASRRHSRPGPVVLRRDGSDPLILRTGQC